LLIIVLGSVGYCLEVSKAFYVISHAMVTPEMAANSMTYIVTMVVALFSPYMLAPILIGMLFIALGFVAELFVSRTIQPERCYSVKKELGDSTEPAV